MFGVERTLRREKACQDGGNVGKEMVLSKRGNGFIKSERGARQRAQRCLPPPFRQR